MMNAIVIDDVKMVRNTIVQLLQNYPNDLSVIAEADSVESGVSQINKFQPDVIFLDVEMKDGTGFDLLKQIVFEKYKIIFITAYDHYAIKAFKYSAVDYLLKPIDIDELTATIQKLKQVFEKETVEIKFNALTQNINSTNKQDKTIVLKTVGNTNSVSIKDIIRCESDNNYTRFYLKDGAKILVSVTLKEYEELFSDLDFFRTHQSHLINLNFFNNIKKADSDFIVLKNGTEIPIATRRKTSFLEVIENFNSNTNSK